MRLFEGTPWDRPPRCETCGDLLEICACPRPPRVSPEKQTARLAVEKRAKGKVVTVVRGLAAEDNNFDDLLKRLKAACGAGGAIDADTIEVQGKHIDRIAEILGQIGYRVRK